MTRRDTAEIVNQFIGSRDWEEPITGTSYDRKAHCEDCTLWNAPPPSGDLIATWWNDDLCIVWEPGKRLGIRLINTLDSRGIAWCENEEAAEAIAPTRSVYNV